MDQSPGTTQAAIDWTGVVIKRTAYEQRDFIFTQGDACASVLLLEEGTVRISVLSHAGKEAVVALLQPGHFFGEGCLAGQEHHLGTATAVTPCTVVEINKQELTRQMHAKPALAERFLTHMLARNIRIEEDLLDHLFNDAEKRLARTLLLMARYGSESGSSRTLPMLSQQTLAEMVGTTRSRVNTFMNKFRKLGFLNYDHQTITVNPTLLSVLLRERQPSPADVKAER